MTPQRWAQVADVYERALATPADQRQSFLKTCCRDDVDLRQQVDSLLQQSTEGFLDQPIGMAAVTLLSADGPRLSIGQQVGPCIVESLVGVGGMGEVYRARDTQLERTVALKVLTGVHAKDSERAVHVRREAQVLASLNHPNIAAIYGIEAGAGVLALVLEFVDGSTLADLIGRKSLSVEDSLKIARQVAEALEVAHDKGITHRDLKPANIKVTPDGVVKVLDFGLARFAAPDHDAVFSNATATPTGPTTALTTDALAIGTPAYMAPEQLRGRPADKRTDVWAFGCLLYELLTCTRAFPGVDVAETLSNVLNTEPDWTALPSATPIGIQRVLRRALEKDRKKRLPDLGVVRLEIDDRTTGPRDGLSTSRAASSGRWIAALLVVAVALVGAFMVGRWSQPSMREIHLNLDTPETQALSSFALSPDGRWVIYAANSDGRPSLWMRSLDTGDVRALAGTADGIRPFWSPDGRSVGFFAGTKLKRLNLADGSIETLARVMNAQGGSWGRDNTILYNPAGFVGGLYRVNAGGGDLAVVTRPDSAGQIGHHSPQWLPDDEHFLYNAGGDPKVRGTYINTRDGSEPRRVIDAPAVYANEELLFIRDGVLYSQPFSIALGLLTGTPQRIATEVAAASVSARGDIVYRPIVAEGERQLVWFDRMGKELERVGSVWVGSVTNPSLSPDGRRVLVQRSSGQNADIWIVDLGTGLPSRLTSNPALDSSPIWSADGRKVLFNSSRRGQSDLFEKAPEITGEERPVVTGAGEKLPSDWSRDGEHILYRAYDQKTGWDIWATRATGERASFPVVRTEFDERDAQFSPDGRSIAFQSDESGQAEIYVQAFPAGEKRRLSTAGGTQPRWRADGKELFYVTLDGVLSAVSLDRGVGDSSTPGVPMPLFSPKMYGTSFTRQQYVVAPNGRFLVMMQIRESPTAPLTVILNRRTDR